MLTDYCSGTVALGEVTAQAIDIEADSSITLANLTLTGVAPPQVALRVRSRAGDVTVYVINGFVSLDGRLLLSYGTTMTAPSNCTLQSLASDKQQQALCGSLTDAGTAPLLANLTAALSIQLSLAAAPPLALTTAPPTTTAPGGDTCTTFVTADPAPASPAIPAEYAGQSFDLNNVNMWTAVTADWSYRTVNLTATGITVWRPQWVNDVWAFIMAPGYMLPCGLHPSRNYRFTFSIRQAATNEKVSADLMYTARAWKLNDFGDLLLNESRVMSDATDPPIGKRVFVVGLFGFFPFIFIYAFAQVGMC